MGRIAERTDREYATRGTVFPDTPQGRVDEAHAAFEAARTAAATAERTVENVERKLSTARAATAKVDLDARSRSEGIRRRADQALLAGDERTARKLLLQAVELEAEAQADAERGRISRRSVRRARLQKRRSTAWSRQSRCTTEPGCRLSSRRDGSSNRHRRCPLEPARRFRLTSVSEKRCSELGVEG